MKYVALLYGERGGGPAPGAPGFVEMPGGFRSATAAMDDAGVLVDGGPLRPPQAAATVRVRDGEALLGGGPFAEIKEQLGGCCILDCEDLDVAVRYAAVISPARYGPAGVRPVMVTGPCWAGTSSGCCAPRGGPRQRRWPGSRAGCRWPGDCAREACAAAVEQRPREGLPADPGGWVVAVARRRAGSPAPPERPRREGSATRRGYGPRPGRAAASPAAASWRCCSRAATRRWTRHRG